MASGPGDLPDAPPRGPVGVDPVLRFEDPRLGELLAYWRRKRGERELPSRSDIRPADLLRHLPNLVLIDVQAEPLRLRYRLLGTAIVQAMQRDNTGAWYDELYGPDLLEEIYAGFRWILAHRAPLRTYGRAFYPDRRFYRYEILNLPLSSDGARVDMVLGELLFTLDSEV
ncbi:PAS domain-containing protein [Marinibaculum pumilum]|uniref:PAS domain-containing protein n=1 Tax=Marinibaculum pumilum TaxID=1766165 RepID=A0ABV7L4Y0_9PROT